MPATTAPIAEKIELHSIADRVEIAPGVRMPRLGLGTWRAHGRPLQMTVRAALKMGYRLFDTSANYNNELEIADELERSEVRRDEVFLTTKLEGSDQGRNRPAAAIRGSLRRLGTDYVDLYLIHWPNPEKTIDTWRALEELVDAGLTRSIGISNFEVSDMEQIAEVCTIPPAVNQIEFHPMRQSRDIHEYCLGHGITLEAWAPIMRGQAGQIPELAAIARRNSKTPEQVCLRWILQKGAVAIPKTVHEARLQENADLYDFELTDEEMAAIDALDEDTHLVW